MPPKWSSRVQIPLSSMGKKYKKTEPFLGSGHFSGFKGSWADTSFRTPSYLCEKHTKKLPVPRAECFLVGRLWLNKVTCPLFWGIFEGADSSFRTPFFFWKLNTSKKTNHIFWIEKQSIYLHLLAISPSHEASYFSAACRETNCYSLVLARREMRLNIILRFLNSWTTKKCLH